MIGPDASAAGSPPLRGKTQALRIAFVCNHSFALKTLYRGLFPYLGRHGIECTAVPGDGSYLEANEDLGGVRIHVIPMERQPAPFKDLVSLVRLIGFFARNRFDIVHVSTPKAALLGALAARLTGHTRIIFVVRIRIYQDRQGIARWVYAKVDWLVSRLSSVVAPISREMGDAMIADGLCPPEKIRYFGQGSSNGINVERFSRTPSTIEIGRALRARLGIPNDAFVMLSMGRLARGKGIHHLPVVMEAALAASRPIWLLLAGPLDSREPTEADVLRDLDGRANVVRIGYQSDPVPFYAAADLFLFPSSREGFGNVALEAQSMGLPVIGFDTPGVREAVADGTTGFLLPMDDSDGFARSAIRLAGDSDLRRKMGDAASRWVRERFSNDKVWTDLRGVFAELAGPSSTKSEPR